MNDANVTATNMDNLDLFDFTNSNSTGLYRLIAYSGNWSIAGWLKANSSKGPDIQAFVEVP